MFFDKLEKDKYKQIYIYTTYDLTESKAVYTAYVYDTKNLLMPNGDKNPWELLLYLIGVFLKGYQMDAFLKKLMQNLLCPPTKKKNPNCRDRELCRVRRTDGRTFIASRYCA